jgi:hypothetical protein
MTGAYLVFGLPGIPRTLAWRDVSIRRTKARRRR